MLDLFSSGLLSLWLNQAEIAGSQVPVNPAVIEQLPQSLAPLPADQTTSATLQQYLDELTAFGFNPNSQGVWIQSDYQVLGKHLGTKPVTAASITKVATSLVALKTWGSNHQFETRISTNGMIQSGNLEGDLVIQGGSDPLFVWETAIALGNALNQLGIQRVTGNLVIAGDFAMNFERNPQVAGKLLRQALDSRTWPEEAAYYFARLPVGTPKPQVEIAGELQIAAQLPPTQRVLLRHGSLPLAQLLKQMNIYSNNEMAEMLAKGLGGGKAVAREAAWAAVVPEEEIQLANGSGLGQNNFISPRAACAMFRELQRELQRWQSPGGKPYTIGDVFPVSGVDQGTIRDRSLPLASVVKTGTLWNVSALAGVLPTRDRGLVWFAILNGGEDIEGLRQSQDQVLQAMTTTWGVPTPPPPTILPTLYNPTPLSGRELADQND